MLLCRQVDMKVIFDIKSYRNLIFRYSIIVIFLNIFLSLVQDIFFKDMSNLSEKTSVTIAVVFWTGIFAPFFEETLLRGIIQRTLEEKTNLSIKVIYVLVAILFSFPHLNAYFIPYFLTSLLLSHSYYKSNNTLLVPISIHVIYNFFVLLLEIIINSLSS